MTLAALEFPEIRRILEGRCRTPYGREVALAVAPESGFTQVRRLQSATSQMALFRRLDGNLPLSFGADIRPSLDRLTVEGSTLAGAEIHTLVAQVKSSLETRALLMRSTYSDLKELGRGLPDLGNLVRFLDGKITPAGQLEDRCSTDLQRIRRQIASLSLRLEAELKAIASRHDIARALQDDFVALRNNRHVLPVRIDAQGWVEGIVHALSSSGSTVYMEPLSTVPLNNELVRLKEQEEVEIHRLLLEFSDLLRGRAAELRDLISRIAEIDLLQARAVLAEEMDGADPDLIEDAAAVSPSLLLSGARHPLLEQALRGTDRGVIPLELTLDSREPVLVVSGPNTGGKTVALKTVGLLAAMAQCGLKVPAREVRLPVFRRILIDIGDHQSISDSLSTFSARMANITTMSREVAPPALVLLDEAGSGTDPEEGAALGVAIIDFFRRRGAFVIATTHHQGIKAYAATTPGVSNACMEFDESSLRPLYRLRAGAPGRSGGLDMAQRLGLSEEIVGQARSLLPQQREALDGYLRSIQVLQEDLRSKRQAAELALAQAERAESERAEREKRLGEQREARFEQLLSEASQRMRREWESALGEMIDKESERRLRREMERREKQAFEAERAALPGDLLPARARPAPASPAALSPGEAVRVPGLNLMGTIERLDGDRVVVRSGSTILKLRREEIERPAAAPGRGTTLPAGVRLSRAQESAPAREIQLIGKTVEEALDLLDKYLDDASLEGVSPLRVIHGHGTGRLRTAIHRFLAEHPQVDGFAEAGEKEGGRGATVVRLRL
ncbi:MAG TPA: Smr/MutS family protein [Candidatus Polarisedimenticolia bacterium]|nr:Smr/MutS family protein [Candidatus Polarisedimenticolia bacterium]